MSEYAIDWRLVLGADGIDGDRFGFDQSELKSLEDAIQAHPPRAVRCGAGITPDNLPFATRPVPWFTAGRFLLDSATRPGGYLHHAAGDYYVQDAGSMLALELSGVRPGQSVCDTCASPGGKSTGLLEQLAGEGYLVSNEVIASRLATLKLALHRTGYLNYLVMNAEVASLAETCGPSFDCVLVDAPCTGQSMVSRGKQSMASYSASQIAHSSARQDRIIRDAARLVRPGGRLVYSTCTFSFSENERVINDFLTVAQGWKLVAFDHLQAWESTALPGSYRLWPHRHDSSGAFAAAMERPVGETMSASELPFRPRRKTKWQTASTEVLDRHWLALPESIRCFLNRSELHAFADTIPESWIGHSVSGVPIAQEKSGRWEPLFASAKLDAHLATHPVVVELDDWQACKFVAGESVRVTADLRGWCVVKWRGRRLAWGKLAQGNLKNHFPKGLRQPAVV